MNKTLFQKAIFPFYHRIKNTKLYERIDELEKNQWQTKEELDRIQKKKLKDLLRHAFHNVPYYRKIFKESGIDLNDLHLPQNFSQLPLITKKEINENRHLMVSHNFKRKNLLKNSTSGSTGEALYFFYDMNSWVCRSAVVIRNQKSIGISHGVRNARIWGATIDLKKAAAFRGRVHSWFNNILFLSSYELSEKNIEKYIKRLNKFKPELLVSYPGPLTVIAEYMIKKKYKIPSLRAIISSAETLFIWQKDAIEQAFSCRVYNRYGCREFGDIGHECLKREGLHINADRVYIEILDENLKNVLNGKNGEIVVTDLDNYGMPLIRYRIGDVASFKPQMCSCGRSLPLLKTVEGRTLDVIKTPNGNRLGGTFWTLLFRSRPGIKNFRVIQDRLNGITVEYVKDTLISNINLNYYEAMIKEKCGNDFIVKFINVIKIPTTTSGKSRFVISRL